MNRHRIIMLSIILISSESMSMESEGNKFPTLPLRNKYLEIPPSPTQKKSSLRVSPHDTHSLSNVSFSTVSEGSCRQLIDEVESKRKLSNFISCSPRASSVYSDEFGSHAYSFSDEDEINAFESDEEEQESSLSQQAAISDLESIPPNKRLILQLISLIYDSIQANDFTQEGVGRIKSVLARQYEELGKIEAQISSDNSLSPESLAELQHIKKMQLDAIKGITKTLNAIKSYLSL